MNGAVGVVRRLKWEQKSFWRNPAAAGFTVAFPLMLLVIFIALNGNERVPLSGRNVRFAQYYVPAIVAMGLISACYTNLALSFAVGRERGFLKRMRGTPLSPAVYLAGIAANVTVIAIILTALTIALGVVAYGVSLPHRYLGLAVTVVLGGFTFGGLGVAVSTVVPNEDAAPALVNFLLFPLLFISGTFFPVDEGTVVTRIASVFPVRHLIQQMVDVFNPFASGTGISANHCLVLLAWGIAGLVIGVRRVRWEPKHT